MRSGQGGAPVDDELLLLLGEGRGHESGLALDCAQMVSEIQSAKALMRV